MGPVHLFALATRHNQYLAARQTTIAGNIANANTPGFKALDLEPFDATMESTRLQMGVSNAKHMSPDGASGSANVSATEGTSWDTVHSGNSVSIEQELLKASETKGAFTLNTTLTRSFHKMLMAATKG
jgi:flagellar basal-body rod protein FlgB